MLVHLHIVYTCFHSWNGDAGCINSKIIVMKSQREKVSKRKILPEPASHTSLLYSYFSPPPPPAKKSLSINAPVSALYSKMPGSQLVSDNCWNLRIFRLSPWSHYNYCQLSLLFSAFLSWLLVLIPTKSVRLEIHPYSTQTARYLHSRDSSHTISVHYHHFLLLLSWLWKLVGFK